ncbi:MULTISPECIES: MerR family transcriptional regulator [Streptomyces]|uniref:MerR family transcriptional regulator n=1 Tax=Streptomyces TaxID=1883 RepID=UPI00017E8375|nr:MULTISPECIES: MerR family transcriptional regulator [Streptomyces]EDX24804.1 merR-family transcriptional regulator [Streptomyces sp. Mg1]MBP0934694.1 MerR family transcriptional regulator [Streptomyces sp. KCTC 0041BP]RPK50568.1 MerR family regulatory protein [Streptomyces sp. ADI91-18]WBY20586.1 MerR family transcriptional regulator [Streptomyces goshikiensis]WSR99362.1 MerR family transcriptional regulator [Streptomyces goshikiensis]
MAENDTDEAGTAVREYRTEELAEAAGIPVRTLRFYRERKLLPPPRREGRIAWYDDHHLARLRTIAALLERGHTLGGIAELTAAFENGRDVSQLGELLGIGWSEETPVRLSPEALADHFEGEVTPENLAASLDLGYLATDGETIVHVSRRLLDVSSALVREGVPLAAVLETGRRVREHADALAGLFTELITAHIGDEAVARLRPLAKSVVEAELTMAMDRLRQPPPPEAPTREDPTLAGQTPEGQTRQPPTREGQTPAS